MRRAPNWADTDFDPSSHIAKIQCPVLSFYGDDEWVPVEDCPAVWQSRMTDPQQVTIEHLPGTAHHPTFHDGRSVESINPQYTETLRTWVRQHASPTRPPAG